MDLASLKAQAAEESSEIKKNLEKKMTEINKDMEAMRLQIKVNEDLR
jgi:hypothetical protein